MRRALIAMLVAAAPAQARTSPADPAPLARRADEVVSILNGGGDAARSFAPAFLAQVPEPKLRALAAQIVAQLGKATRIDTLTPTGATSARLRVAHEKGHATMELVIDPAIDSRISGLLVTGIENADMAQLRTLADVAAAIARLPGRAGFVVADPDAKEEPPLAALAPGTPLAIGSTFKLVILAELVRAIDAGERHWDDRVALDGRELPAGGFNHLPAGTPLPLAALAEAMIKVSDNSATDILIHALGRDRIEAMQTRLGWRDAAANTPFLTTMEAFKLKGVDGGELGRRYLDSDTRARRVLLDGDVAATKGDAIGPLFADGRPVMADRIEWFATPTDLVHTMTWLRDRATTRGGAEALRILAINPGPARALTGQYAYAGYKGGSEPGIISMTLLLRTRAGRWRVVTASWNDPTAPVDELRFANLVRRAAELVLVDGRP